MTDPAAHGTAIIGLVITAEAVVWTLTAILAMLNIIYTGQLWWGILHLVLVVALCVAIVGIFPDFFVPLATFTSLGVLLITIPFAFLSVPTFFKCLQVSASCPSGSDVESYALYMLLQLVLLFLTVMAINGLFRLDEWLTAMSKRPRVTQYVHDVVYESNLSPDPSMYKDTLH